MQFKYHSLIEEFERLDVRLQVIGYAIDGYCINEFDIHIMVTSVYRKKSPTHSRYCAFDIRIKPDDGLPIFTNEQLVKLKKFCKTIKYDINRPSKPTLFIHPNESGKGKHGHLQVWPGSSKTMLVNN